MKITRELPVGTFQIDPPVGTHHDPAIGMTIGREIIVGA